MSTRLLLAMVTPCNFRVTPTAYERMKTDNIIGFSIVSLVANSVNVYFK